jgi:hypothetical protein
MSGHCDIVPLGLGVGRTAAASWGRLPACRIAITLRVICPGHPMHWHYRQARRLPHARRGKSGLHRIGWSTTPTGRKARESATESKPPRRLGPPSKWAAAVRVKRCGKSAPAVGATRLARQTPPGARPSRAFALLWKHGGARVDPARIGARVGCSRRRAIGVLEKWPSRSLSAEADYCPDGRRAAQNPAYRPAPRPLSSALRYSAQSALIIRYFAFARS